jgi:Ca2+/Na+ antiporter
MKQYLTTKFLFSINSVMLERVDKVFFVIGAILFILAVVFKLAAIFSPTPVDSKYRNKFFNLFLTIGLSELVWFAARWQNVRFFGSHFVSLFMLLIGLVWLGYILKDIIKNYKEQKVSYEKEQVKLKYLPENR